MKVAASGAQLMSGATGPVLSRIRQIVLMHATDLIMFAETHVSTHDLQ